MDRQDAYREFDAFADEAENRFKEIMKNDEKAKELASCYSFYVVKGGAQGAVDKRIVEIFFGNRPFDNVAIVAQDTNGFPQKRNTFLTEQGACLRYERTDMGTVMVTLYPATTENLKQYEDFILYEYVKDPRRLRKNRYNRVHWRAFISYMQCTSIDGKPSFSERARKSWIKVSRKLAVNGKVQQPKLVEGCLLIGRYVITVGLSGFLLALILRT